MHQQLKNASSTHSWPVKLAGSPARPGQRKKLRICREPGRGMGSPLILKRTTSQRNSEPKGHSSGSLARSTPLYAGRDSSVLPVAGGCRITSAWPRVGPATRTAIDGNLVGHSYCCSRRTIHTAGFTAVARQPNGRIFCLLLARHR